MAKKKQLAKQEIRVGILTLYLYKSIDEVRERHSEEEIQLQKKYFGYNEDNLSGIRTLDTDSYTIILETSEQHTTQGPMECHLVIAGSTPYNEARVESLKMFGTLVGRYSTFYGEPSGYTDRSPEQGGYAFDIPKSVDTVRKLLASDRFIDAIVEREETKIRDAIGELNKELPRPVLITPYLTEALQKRRQMN